jgi:hypothetical protein
LKIREKGPRGGNRHQALFACALLAVALVAAVAWPYLFPKAPAAAVPSAPAVPSFPGFSLSKNSTDGVFEYYAYSGGNATLRLRIARGVDAASASTLVRNDVLAMRALYNDALNPYPDVVSDKITYSPDFLPTYGADGGFSYFEAFLTSRMTYGAFTHDTAPYRGVISWEYCPALRQLRQLEVIMGEQAYSPWAVGYAKGNVCN